jgi:hypothetical protein
MTHPERAASQQLQVDFQQEQLHWLFHLQLRYPEPRKVPPATRQLKSSLGLDIAYHSGSRMQDSHVFQNRSSVIGDDNFSSTRLDLSSASHVLCYKMNQLTILSIPFGPRLVRTASETAKHKHSHSLSKSKIRLTLGGIHVR